MTYQKLSTTDRAIMNSLISRQTKNSWTCDDIRKKRMDSMKDAGQGPKQAIMTPRGPFASITEASANYNISRQTMYSRLKKNPAYYYINDEVL